MELTALKFNVETQRLKDAKDAIDALAVSMQKLDAVSQKEVKTAIEVEKIREEEAKTAIQLSNLKQQEVKESEAVAKAKSNEAKAKSSSAAATDDEVSSLSALEKVITKAIDKTEILRSGTLELGNETVTLSRAFTAGQAAQLASAKLMGATADQIQLLAKQFKDFNAFSGINTFDKASSGLEKLKHDLNEVRVVNELLSKGWNLTLDQIKGLGRDMVALTQTMQAYGASEKEIAAAINKLQKETVDYANSLNVLTAASKASAAAAKAEAEAIAQAEKAKIDAISNSVKSIEKAYSVHLEKVNQQRMINEAASEANRAYYAELEAQDKLAEKNRKDSFDTKLKYHELYQQQERLNYEQDMQVLRNHFAEQERISEIGEKQLASVRDRIQRRTLALGYSSTHGVSMTTANTAAELEMKGADPSVIKSYIEEAAALEKVAAAHRQKLNAAKAVEAEEERLFATVAHINDEMSNNSRLNERAALALGVYERNLKLAGYSAEESAKKLQAFKAAQQQISEHEAKNRSNYVSRGIGVQMGDVAVSLASGMNPLTVAIQQGDQIRGLLLQSGLAASEMGIVMSQAMKGIVTSFRDVGVAIGSFVAGGIKYLGQSVIETAGKVDILKVAFKKYSDEALREAGINATGEMIKYNKILNMTMTATGATIAAFGVALIGVTAAMYQNAKANESLNESLVLYGARLGTTKQSLIDLAKSTAGLSTSSNEMKGFFSELIQGGFKSKDSLETIANSAKELSHVTSLSLSEIAKKYVELSKDPVEGLIKLGIEQGYVTLKTVKHVEELKKQGKEAEAVSLAIQAMSSSMSSSARQVEKDLSPLTILLNNIRELGTDIKQVFLDIANSASSILLAIGNAPENLMKKTRELMGGKNTAPGSADWQKTTDLSFYKKLIQERASLTDKDLADQREANAKALEEYKKYVEKTKFLQQGENKLLARKLSEKEYIAKRIAQLDAQPGGALTEKDRQSATLTYKEEYKSYQDKDATKQLSDYTSAMKTLVDMQIELTRANTDSVKPLEETTKAYTALEKIKDSPKWKTFTAEQKKNLEQIKDENVAIEIRNLRLTAHKKAMEDLKKMREALSAEEIKNQAAYEAGTKEIDFQYSLIGKTAGEVRQMTIEHEYQAKVMEITVAAEARRVKLMQDYADISKNIDPENLQDIALAQQKFFEGLNQIETDAENKRTLARKKANLDVVQDYYNTLKNYSEQISNAIYDALTGKSKDAAKALRKMIADELKKPIVATIQVVVSGTLDSAAKAVGIDPATFSSDKGIFGNLMGNASNAQSAYNLFSGNSLNTAQSLYNNYIGGNQLLGATLPYWGYTGAGISAVGGGVAAGLNFAGAGITAPVAAPVITGAAGSGLTLSGAGIGSGLNFSGAGITGAVSGSTSLGVGAGAANLTTAPVVASTTTTAASSALSTMATAAPYIAAAVAVYSLFSGKFGGGGGPKSEIFGGDRSIDWGLAATAGGNSGLDAIAKGVEDSFNSILTSFGKSAIDIMVGIGGDADPSGKAGTTAGYYLKGGDVTRFNQFSVNDLSGNTFALVAQKALLAALEAADVNSVVDSYLNTLNIGTLTAEQANTAMQVISNLYQLQQTLADLGFGANALSQELVNALGGIDSFQSKMNAFYEGYFTSEEKAARQTKQLEAVFKSLGVEMPNSRKEFRDLIMELTNTGGTSATLAGQLINLSDAFGQVADAAEAATQAMLDQVDKARNDLLSAYSNESKTLTETKSKFEDFVKTIADFRSSLLMGELSPLDPVAKYTQAKADFTSISTKAQLGDEEAIAKLQSSSETFLNASRAMYASGVEYNQDFASVMSALDSTESLAVRQAKIATDSLTELSKQSSLLGSIDAGVLTVADAMNALSAALAPLAAQGYVAPAGSSASGMTYKSSAGASYALDTGLWSFLDQGTTPVTSRQAKEQALALMAKDNGPQAIYDAAKRLGVSLTDVNSIMGWRAGEAEAWAKSQGLPSFDIGINRVPNDTLAMVHKDEAIIPAAFNPWAGGSLADNSKVAELIQSLIQEVAELRKQQANESRQQTGATLAAAEYTAEKVSESQREAAWKNQIKEKLVA